MGIFTKSSVPKQPEGGGLLWASSLGLHLVLCAVIGFFIGRFIDSHVHTAPVFTAAFFVLGIVAGFMEIWRGMKKLEQPKDGLL